MGYIRKPHRIIPRQFALSVPFTHSLSSSSSEVKKGGRAASVAWSRVSKLRLRAEDEGEDAGGRRRCHVDAAAGRGAAAPHAADSAAAHRGHHLRRRGEDPALGGGGGKRTRRRRGHRRRRRHIRRGYRRRGTGDASSLYITSRFAVVPCVDVDFLFFFPITCRGSTGERGRESILVVR